MEPRRKKQGILSLVMACLLLQGSMVSAYGADTAQLKKALREILREEPELIMDVLRQNSVELFEVVREGNRIARDRAMRAQWQADMATPKKVRFEDRPIRGAVDAPVTIVAFSDFTCPYCAQAAATVASLLTHYKGKIRLVFKHYPLQSHENAEVASRLFAAASMQDSEKAWALYDSMFVDHAWVSKEGQSFILQKAAALGLNIDTLVRDAQSEAVTRILQEDKAEAKAVGVEGTPVFLVNDIVVRGALPLDLFSNAVDMAWEETQKR